MNRIKTMPTETLVDVGIRVFQTIDNLMGGPHMGYQPYGWDWPTASVLIPRKVSIWRAIAAEVRSRGVKNVPIDRYTQKDGKIIVKRIGEITTSTVG